MRKNEFRLIKRMLGLVHGGRITSWAPGCCVKLKYCARDALPRAERRQITRYSTPSDSWRILDTFGILEDKVDSIEKLKKMEASMVARIFQKCGIAREKLSQFEKTIILVTDDDSWEGFGGNGQDDAKEHNVKKDSPAAKADRLPSSPPPTLPSDPTDATTTGRERTEREKASAMERFAGGKSGPATNGPAGGRGIPTRGKRNFRMQSALCMHICVYGLRDRSAHTQGEERETARRRR